MTSLIPEADSPSDVTHCETLISDQVGRSMIPRAYYTVWGSASRVCKTSDMWNRGQVARCVMSQDIVSHRPIHPQQVMDLFVKLCLLFSCRARRLWMRRGWLGSWATTVAITAAMWLGTRPICASICTHTPVKNLTHACIASIKLLRIVIYGLT